MNDYGSKVKKRIIAVAVGAAVNLLLFFAKLYVGLSSNSIAIYADSLNSLIDFAVCLAAAAGFRFSSASSSEKYPFGKGRAEDLTELLISAVILVSGGMFAYISFERILYPVPVWYSSLYAVIIALTAAVKLAMSFFFSASFKKLGSDTLKGLAADSRLDFFITACTLVSFLLSSEAGFSVDGFAGLLISILLIAEGVKTVFASFGKILGKRKDSLCEKAKNIISNEKSVICVKDIQYHAYGERGVFTADIETDCRTAKEIENLCLCLNEKIKKNFNSEIFITFGGER